MPDDVLVLPAHNDPFIGLHARLDHLIRGHERGLDRLEKALAEPKRSIDVFGSLFARTIGLDLLGMATGESLAHLNCLLGRGRAVTERDEHGVLWYQRQDRRLKNQGGSYERPHHLALRARPARRAKSRPGTT